MIQQIMNTKNSKQLTHSDLQRISYASCLNFFSTDIMFKDKPGVYYSMNCYWIKRISNDNYQFQECYANTGAGTAPSGMSYAVYGVSTRTLNQIRDIHSDLVCDNDGDERLIIECAYRWIGKTQRKKELGFFILTPPRIFGLNKRNPSAFLYQTVITPKPGLFPAIN